MTAILNYLLATAGLGVVLFTIIITGRKTMSGLTDLQDALTKNTALTKSAVDLLKTLTSAGDSDSQVGALAATLASNNASLEAALTAATPVPVITISPTALPLMALTTSYSATLSAAGGVAPYVFTTSSGSFPPGVSMDATGVITGAPTTAGTYPVSVVATDAKGVASASVPYTFTI